MKKGDWVEVRGSDIFYCIESVRGEFLMVDDDHGYRKDACILMTLEECRRCGEQKPNGAQERYSYGVYAGRMCDDCAYNGYRDHCGGGDPQDLDEDLEPEPW